MSIVLPAVCSVFEMEESQVQDCGLYSRGICSFAQTIDYPAALRTVAAASLGAQHRAVYEDIERNGVH